MADALNTFISRLEEEFGEVTPGSITPETSFRNMPDWSSMHTLIIIALVDAEYDVLLSGKELLGLETVQDLFNHVMKRKEA